MSKLTLEIYARILARLACRRGAPLADILAELGISPDELREAEPTLRAQLAEAWDRRKGLPAMKFATALGEELTRLGPLAGEHGSSGGAWPDELPSSAPPRDVQPTLPSYLHVPPTPALGLMPPAPALATPAPLAAAASPQPPPVQTPIERSPAGADLAGTMQADFREIRAALERGALPFAGPGSVSSAGQSPPSSVRPETQASVSGTGREEPRDGASAHAPAAPAPVRPLGAHLAGTMDTDFRAIKAAMERGPLPFGRPEAPPTVDDAAAPLPPLETYAGVTGALARGEPRDEVLARHGLSPDAYAKMAKGWGDRFGRDPHLLATFQELARNSAASSRRSE